MNLPPISNDYNSSIQTVLQDEIEKADKQNFKLDKDNFLTSSSICLQSPNGKWWQITVNNSGTIGASELTTTDGRLDSEGRPNIATQNPYYTP